LLKFLSFLYDILGLFKKKKILITVKKLKAKTLETSKSIQLFDESIDLGYIFKRFIEKSESLAN